MSYEKELDWECGQVLYFEYSLNGDSLKLDSWQLFKGNTEIVPDRDTSTEIENYIANWLEKRYSIYAMNYVQDLQDSILEKRYQGDK